MKLLLTHGADPTHVGDDSNSSIHWLLYEGRRDLARLLVQHGAPVTLEQLVELGMIDRVRARLAETQEFPWIPECEAALVVAAAKGNTSIVKLLLDAVDRSGKSIDLDPALAAAVEHGQRRVAALLFDRGADLLQLGDYRRSLLHRAAHAGQVDMVRCLLAGNLNVNYPDRDGITPLHLAAMGGNIGVMAVLINAGAEVNAHDDKGRTPLHLAAERGLKDAVQMFLDHKADANAKDEEGQSPLHLAAKHGHKEATHLLLAAGVDVNAKDKHGVRPLHLVLTEPAERIWMCGNGMEVEMFRVTPPEHLAVAELLLAHKADANATDNQGRPPLEYIHPLVGRKDLAELLMKKGADGAIFVAMRFGDAQRVRDMLKANPDLVAARDSKYGTPLHEAARQGQREMAEVLLAHRADIFARDARGLRPRDLALEAGDVALAKLLGP